MCGIVGYTGKQSVAKQILDALELLEYRGYDSAGMAIVDETNGQVQIRKRAGRVADLEKVWKANPVNGICGIGHTRWGNPWRCQRCECTSASCRTCHIGSQWYY